MSVLSNSKVEISKDLPATILNLCIEGFLKSVKDKVRIVYEYTGKDMSSLLQHEKFLIKNINHISTNSFNFKKWENLIYEDCINLNLIKYKNNENTNPDYISLKKDGCFEIFIIILPFILAVILGGDNNITNSESIIMLISALFAPMYYSSEEIKMNFNSIRTKNGEEHYKKWLSLKNFLENYTLINTRDVDEIIIWEKYLAYAIALNINKKAIDFFKTKVLNTDLMFDLDRFIQGLNNTNSYF